MLAQTLAVPVRGASAGGSDSNVQRRSPVRASSAKTLPGGATVSAQSLPAQPTISRSPITVGGCSSDSGHLRTVFH
jgi:hypothetical protein